MKILKLLNKKYLPIFFYFLFLQSFEALSNEPVDIWNIDNKENLKVNSLESDVEKNNISENSIYEMEVRSIF